MTNLELFDYSSKHPEPEFDPYYTGNMVVLSSSTKDANPLMKFNHELVELATVFSYLMRQNRTDDDPEVAKVVSRVVSILNEKIKDHRLGINYTPLVQFFMTKNSSFDMYAKTPKDKRSAFVFKMLRLYCLERHDMYLNHGYTDSTLQVVCDNYSHKRKCKASQDKLSHMIELHGYTLDRNGILNPNKRSFFLPDKAANKVFADFVIRNSICAACSTDKHNKKPDMVFNVGEELYIVEMKTMKGQGGGQNQQVIEVANFIRHTETNPHIHYMTFMDAERVNEIFGRASPKERTQYDDIYNSLKACPRNYFVNTAGMELFLRTHCGDKNCDSQEELLFPV